MIDLAKLEAAIAAAPAGARRAAVLSRTYLEDIVTEIAAGREAIAELGRVTGAMH